MARRSGPARGHGAARTARPAGIERDIIAETNDRDLMVSLVQQGAGARFSYGREAAAAVAGGAGLVHLSPPPFRQLGAVFDTRREPSSVP